MRAIMGGCIEEISNIPGRGERVAKFVRAYLKAQPGLSTTELSIRLKADRRDIERVLRDESVGHRLEDKLAAYFGQTFIDALFPPEHFGGRSIRERELIHELAQLEARNRKLERERAERRSALAGDGVRMAADQGRLRDVSGRGSNGNERA